VLAWRCHGSHLADGPVRDNRDGRARCRRGGGGRKLPRLAGPRPDDLDAAPVRGHDVHPGKFAFPKIGEALEKRANAIRDNIEASERQREEADKLLDEYRQRLREAREQADDIVARARKASEAAVAEATSEGKTKREELVAAARKDIEAETRRSLEQIRKEVADLTVLATEKITRKALDDDDQRRLVEEALAEVDFSTLAGNGAEERA
jgi:F-type H+-transporting ATPase subunit b